MASRIVFCRDSLQSGEQPGAPAAPSRGQAGGAAIFNAGDTRDPEAGRVQGGRVLLAHPAGPLRLQAAEELVRSRTGEPVQRTGRSVPSQAERVRGTRPPWFDQEVEGATPDAPLQEDGSKGERGQRTLRPGELLRHIRLLHERSDGDGRQQREDEDGTEGSVVVVVAGEAGRCRLPQRGRLQAQPGRRGPQGIGVVPRFLPGGRQQGQPQFLRLGLNPDRPGDGRLPDDPVPQELPTKRGVPEETQHHRRTHPHPAGILPQT